MQDHECVLFDFCRAQLFVFVLRIAIQALKYDLFLTNKNVHQAMSWTG